jgi:hypothetical protein
MPDTPVLSKKQRDAIFSKLKTDANFREDLKTDWKKAIKKIGITPEKLAQGVLSYKEVVPFQGQRASWTIEIVIAGRIPGQERVNVAYKEKSIGFKPR